MSDPTANDPTDDGSGALPPKSSIAPAPSASTDVSSTNMNPTGADRAIAGTPVEATAGDVDQPELTDRIYILCHFADESSIYESWLERLPIPFEVVSGYTPLWEPPEDAALVITHMHYSWEELSILRNLQESYPSLPVLILSDGILEYRNTWKHPDLPEGSLFQPLFGHKLACIGKSQVRAVESWGNLGRCEAVGLPRLDAVLESKPPKVTDAGPFRLLIATANTPAFNDQQRDVVIKSLTHLKKVIDANTVINGRNVELIWRLTSGLDEEIGLPSPSKGKKPSLLSVIDQVDAVITTPSTLYLESVLKKRPTAVLDFHNTPMYVASAWTINAPTHMRQTLLELESPPAPKMLFQDAVLQDSLECRSPAIPRLLTLIEAMLEAGQQARAQGTALVLPYRILTDPEKGFFPVLESFELHRLYPDNEFFQNDDVARLQIEVEALTKRLDSAPVEIMRLRNQCLNYSKLILEMQEAQESSLAVIAKMKEQITALKNRCADLKERHDTQLQRANDVKERYSVAQTAYRNLKKWKEYHEAKMAEEALDTVEAASSPIKNVSSQPEAAPPQPPNAASQSQAAVSDDPKLPPTDNEVAAQTTTQDQP